MTPRGTLTVLSGSVPPPLNVLILTRISWMRVGDFGVECVRSVDRRPDSAVGGWRGGARLWVRPKMHVFGWNSTRNCA